MAATRSAQQPAFLVIEKDEIRDVAEELARVRTKEVRTADQWVVRILRGKASIRGIRIRVGRSLSPETRNMWLLKKRAAEAKKVGR